MNAIERESTEEFIAKHFRNPDSIANGGQGNAPPSASKGFSLVELMVVIIIIALLIAAFLKSDSGVWGYQEQAERAAMVQVAGAVQSALLMEYGHMMISSKQGGEVAALARENPMNWMLKIPENYAGEFYEPIIDKALLGKWVFDLKSREFIYVPKLTDNLESGSDGNKWVRYHVRLVYDPMSKAVIQGALFEPVEPYKWFD